MRMEIKKTVGEEVIKILKKELRRIKKENKETDQEKLIKTRINILS